LTDPIKISIITVLKNNHNTAEDCIKSVLNQSYGNIEHIVIDGASTDGTLEILDRFKDRISKIVSEKDLGAYYAFNKGIGLATGDVIGFLNGDDIYSDSEVIKEAAKAFIENGLDSVYGDLLYVNRNDPNKVIRYWKAGDYTQKSLKTGWMPPHPTFFVRKAIYEKYGCFNTDFGIAADYEMILRLLYKYNISTRYIPMVLVKMRVGGRSNKTLKNIIQKSLEDYRACRIYGLGYLTLLSKNLRKLPQFLVRNPR